MRILSLLFCLVVVFSCKIEKKERQNEKIKKVDSILPKYIAKSFDFPVGRPNARGYYNAQKFTENNHLGEDWNSVKGGNSDLGDPIYNIADGYVKEAKNYGGGWGNVIRIVHYLPNSNKVESLYAHCDTIFIKEKQWVRKGDKIGTIGTANGAYFAHLHFEMRDDLNLPLGAGYSSNTKGYINPTKFIKTHREIR